MAALCKNLKERDSEREREKTPLGRICGALLATCPVKERDKACVRVCVRVCVCVCVCVYRCARKEREKSF